MVRELDFAWLRQQAVDDRSKLWIAKIDEWRRLAIERNEFIIDNRLFSVNLGKYRLWLRAPSAFSSVEVYVEIFKEGNHFLVPEFADDSAALVVDVGANQGFYALRTREHNPRCKIICIEPNPYMFEMLEKNFKTNNVRNVVLVNKAIGSNDGKVALEFTKHNGAVGGKSLRIVDRPWLKDEYVERIPVDAITLETLYREHRISRIDILKIDIEGMEVDALWNSRHLLGSVHRIVVERHTQKLRDEVVKLLTDSHFALLYDEDPQCKRYYGDLYFANKNWNHWSCDAEGIR